MARSGASGVSTDPEGTDRTIPAQGADDGGQFYGVEGRHALYVDLHNHAAAIALLRWEGGLYQEFVQAIDDALGDGRDVEWIRQAISGSYETRYAGVHSICWFVPGIYAAMRDGIPNAAEREARTKRGQFGAAWKAAKASTVRGGVPTFAAIVSEMRKAGVYDWFLSGEAEPLIMLFSEQESPNAGIAQDNARAWRKELARLRARDAEGDESPKEKLRATPKEPAAAATLDETPESVVAAAGAILGEMVNRLGALASAGTTAEETWARRQEAARRAFQSEAASVEHACPEAKTSGEGLSREEFERELAVVKARRSAKPQRFAQDDARASAANGRPSRAQDHRRRPWRARASSWNGGRPKWANESRGPAGIGLHATGLTDTLEVIAVERPATVQAIPTSSPEWARGTRATKS